MNLNSFSCVYSIVKQHSLSHISAFILAIIAACIIAACSKKDHKVSNPTAVELYSIHITNFPTNPPQGGTWDSEIFLTDPFGRPDLHVVAFDNNWDTLGSTGGYTKLNANHANLPIDFDVEPGATVSLDKAITLYVGDNDDFDSDDFMGYLYSDTLSKFKEEQPSYLDVSNGNLAARLYIKWK